MYLTQHYLNSKKWSWCERYLLDICVIWFHMQSLRTSCQIPRQLPRGGLSQSTKNSPHGPETPRVRGGQQVSANIVPMERYLRPARTFVPEPTGQQPEQIGGHRVSENLHTWSVGPWSSMTVPRPVHKHLTSPHLHRKHGRTPREPSPATSTTPQILQVPEGESSKLWWKSHVIWRCFVHLRTWEDRA